MANDGLKGPLLAGLAGLLIGGAVVGGFYTFRSGNAVTPAAVRAALLEEPDMLREAMERLQSNEMAEAVGQNRAAIERPFGNAWAGNENGDVTLVEFFDYACGFCRASNPVVERLLREDPRLKVVWRELPVLGPDSEQAAIASLTAAQNGRFKQFHDTLFQAARPTAAAIAQARQATGVPQPQITPEIRAEVERNIQLARAIGASGTPTFVVGNRVFQGAVGYDALKRAIEEARTARTS